MKTSAVLFLLATFATIGWGQNIAGSIVGTITDASGAAVPSAVVTINNEATNLDYKLP